jgi:hypothetical protein
MLTSKMMLTAQQNGLAPRSRWQEFFRTTHKRDWNAATARDSNRSGVGFGAHWLARVQPWR